MRINSTLPPPAHVPWRAARAGAVAGVLIGLLVHAPAAWLAWAVKAGTQGQLVLQDARGTLWSGSAQLMVTGGQGSQDVAALPGQLSWKLRPAGMAVRVELLTTCCTPQAVKLTVRPAWQRVTLEVADHQSHWPALWLSGLGTPWNTLRPEGQLTISTRHFSVDWAQGRWTMDGSAQLDAVQMSSRLSLLRPIGSYRLSLQGGQNSRMQLETLEGPLILAGHGQWNGSNLHFEGEARAAAQSEDALSNLLNIIGRRDGARSVISLG